MLIYMFKVLLPLLAFTVVLVGLIAVEPPPTKEELEQKQRREMLSQIQAEQGSLIDQLSTLERKEQRLRIQINKLNKLRKVGIDTPELRKSLEHVRNSTETDKRAVEASIVDVNEEMSSVERKAEEWVRTAYNLTPDALPPGYLARVLWQLDGSAIAESGKLAKDLRATLHISETASQAAAQRLSKILKSGYARRTLVSAAAALATLALLESAEPVFGWFFNRWWKLLAASIAGLLAFGGVVLLQRRKVFE